MDDVPLSGPVVGALDDPLDLLLGELVLGALRLGGRVDRSDLERVSEQGRRRLVDRRLLEGGLLDRRLGYGGLR